MSTIRLRSPAAFWLAVPAGAWTLAAVVVPTLLILWVPFWGGRAFSAQSPLTFDKHIRFFSNASYLRLIGSTVWPVVVEVASKGIPLRYAVAKVGYRAWCQGQAISPTTRNLDACYEWLNVWLEGFAGARQTEIGYFSTIDTYTQYLPPELLHQAYGGEGRDGGSLEDRSQRVYVWNTHPTKLEYDTEKWNEFLAA